MQYIKGYTTEEKAKDIASQKFFERFPAATTTQYLFRILEHPDLNRDEWALELLDEYKNYWPSGIKLSYSEMDKDGWFLPVEEATTFQDSEVIVPISDYDGYTREAELVDFPKLHTKLKEVIIRITVKHWLNGDRKANLDCEVQFVANNKVDPPPEGEYDELKNALNSGVNFFDLVKERIIANDGNGNLNSKCTGEIYDT